MLNKKLLICLLMKLNRKPRLLVRRRRNCVFGPSTVAKFSLRKTHLPITFTTLLLVIILASLVTRAVLALQLKTFAKSFASAAQIVRIGIFFSDLVFYFLIL